MGSSCARSFASRCRLPRPTDIHLQMTNTTRRTTNAKPANKIFLIMILKSESDPCSFFESLAEMLNNLGQALGNLFHVGNRKGRVSETSERVTFVPEGVGNFHSGIVNAPGIGVFLGLERKAGATESVLFLEGGLSVTLRPKNFPARHPLGRG